jgi:two-component system cell cycle sensor histidine kinase/response regulator CckA
MLASAVANFLRVRELMTTRNAPPRPPSGARAPGRATTGQSRPPEEAAARRQPREGRDSILIAEDDAALRALLSAMLEASGYGVILAANGIEALRLAERSGGRLSLLIADVTMPEMGGLELARRLRARCGPLKVLLLSGYERGDLEADLGDPGLVFVQKPFSPRALAQTVREMLKATGGEPAKS